MKMGFTISVSDEIDPLRQEWERLAIGVDAPPFAHPGWHEAWWAAFGRGRLELVQLRRRDELHAVLPLTQHSGQLRSPTNWHTPSFAPLCSGLDAERQLLSATFQRREGCIELDYLTCEHTLRRTIDSARAERRTLMTQTTAHQPYIALDGSWDDYLATLSANRRKSLRQTRRRLDRAGRVTFGVADGAENLTALLADAYAVERSGWKGARGTAIASQPSTRRFYDDVADWASELGFLRLGFLRLDDVAIAFDFALEHDGTWYSLKAGYDERFRRYGPGALLLARELEWAFDRRLRRFELLGDDDAFKSSWTQASRPVVCLRAIARTVPGQVARMALLASDRLVPALRAAGRRLLR